MLNFAFKKNKIKNLICNKLNNKVLSAQNVLFFIVKKKS